MMRRIPARPAPLALLLPLVLGWAGQALGEVPGYLFRVEQPISSEQVDRIGRAADRILRDEADRGGEAVLVFEFAPGSSDYGVSIQLADLIASKLGAAKATVAYLPESVSGYALFPAFACDEIVAGESTAIGPLYREESDSNEVLNTFAVDLARRKGRPKELLLGMLDPQSELGTLSGPDGRLSLVDRAAIPRADREDADFEPLWIAGATGSFTADRGRAEGFIRAVVGDRGELEGLYDLGRLVEEDLSRNGERTAYWVRISGRFDAPKAAYLKRQLARAEAAEARVIILQLDTAGGDLRLADQLAVRIARIERATTVAYIRDRAIGVPASPGPRQRRDHLPPRRRPRRDHRRGRSPRGGGPRSPSRSTCSRAGRSPWRPRSGIRRCWPRRWSVPRSNSSRPPSPGSPPSVATRPGPPEAGSSSGPNRP